MPDPAYKARRREALKTHLLDEHLTAIGHVAIRAAHLDFVIESIAKGIQLRFPEVVRGKVDKFSIPDKLKLIKQVLSANVPEHQNAISEFISEINAARTDRNDFMHSLWGATEAPEIKELIAARAPDRPARRVTAKIMMALSEKLIDLTFEMTDWWLVSQDAQRRQYDASLGKRPLPTSPPMIPRTSARDQKKKLQLGFRQPGS